MDGRNIWNTWMGEISEIHGWEKYLKHMDRRNIWNTWIGEISEIHGWEKYLKYMDRRNICNTWIGEISETHYVLIIFVDTHFQERVHFDIYYACGILLLLIFLKEHQNNCFLWTYILGNGHTCIKLVDSTIDVTIIEFKTDLRLGYSR